MKNVYPSPGRRAALAAPSVPPAPATFSTINCWPSAAEYLTDSGRAKASTPPPGANGLTIVTGFAGQACAWASALAVPSAPPAIRRTHVDALLLILSPLLTCLQLVR